MTQTGIRVTNSLYLIKKLKIHSNLFYYKVKHSNEVNHYLFVKKSLIESSKMPSTLEDFCFFNDFPETIWTYDLTRNVQHCVIWVLMSKNTGVAVAKIISKYSKCIHTVTQVYLLRTPLSIKTFKTIAINSSSTVSVSLIFLI